MKIIHFTPGSLNPQTTGCRGAVASLPLANGDGGFVVSGTYLAPQGEITVTPEHCCQLLLIVNGRAVMTYLRTARLDVSAGMGMLLEAGEGCQLTTEGGAMVLAIGARVIAADECGISSPDRVAGQQWPSLRSD